MSKPIYIFFGTFSPPTIGHFNIVCQAAKMFKELIIVCSVNPDKGSTLFSPDKCKNLWQTYNLPKNVRVLTLAELRMITIKRQNIVMIRGIRDSYDFEYEKEVMTYNQKTFGINKFFYIHSGNKYKNISSTKARELAEKMDLRGLARMLSPLAISSLLEKTLGAKNIFLVIGRPGSGKSTFLKMLTEISSNNFFINTDNYNSNLRSVLIKKFGEEDLIKIALKNDAELKRAIAKPWFGLLSESLQSSPWGSNVFIEIPHGLQKDKLMFRFVGGKIIYFGCENETENIERVVARGTPKLVAFIQKIPDKFETIAIAKQYNLSVKYINTSCSLNKLRKKAEEFNENINRGD
jgi:pantetheine-phosphate adenylyltransferase